MELSVISNRKDHNMPTIANQIAGDILELPASDRAFLAHHLIQSLDEHSDSDAEALWMEEIDRRSAEIRNKRVECRPAGDVIADIRRKLHNARSS
ncbi:addiction module protein [Desulfococcaceae bacterium HSG8]|nr:addiction module protein [Desulfococcaceae bacterium HSG8]